MLKKFCTISLAAILSVTCFVGCGDNEEQSSARQPHNIKNIIVIIGDGMGPVHVQSGERYEERTYTFTSWHQTQVDTTSYKTETLYAITDSAAGATAISTGTLTMNGRVARDIHGQDLQTVMDIAKEKGKATAVVSTDYIYGATPATFSGHARDRDDYDDIIYSQITTSNVDLLCGSCSDLTQTEEIKALVAENGYTYCDDMNHVDAALETEKAYLQLDMFGIDGSVSLAQATQKALSFVERDEDGFVMMLEQGHIDKYSHDNDFDGMVKSMMDLQDTVEVVMQWIGNRTDTAVLVTADHETGKLKIVEEYNQYIYTYKSVTGKDIYYRFVSEAHSDRLVGLYTYGIQPNFATFGKYGSATKIKNSETGMIMMNLLNDPTMY